MRVLAVSSVLGSLVSATGNSSVKKVISLLEEMKGKVETETARGKQEAEEKSDWCIKSITETTADVKYGGEKVEELAAAAENGNAVAAAKAAEAVELGMEIGKSQASQKKAKAERKTAHTDFQAEEVELVEADTMLQKAYSVLKRSLSFAQTDGKSAQTAYTEEAVAAIGAIIDSAWIDIQDAGHLKVFLQADQPQATVSNYESRSGGILQAIQGMQEKNAEILASLREKEMSSRHKFELIVQDLVNTEQSKSEQMAAAKGASAKATTEAKEAEAAGSEAADTLAADTRELAATKAGCESYAKEWDAREADATTEIGVIAQAIEILSGKFGSEEGSFLQVSATDRESTEFNRRQKAASLLRHMGREFNQYGLLQVAQAASDDPFIKVRGMIADMITKLEDEAQKEADKEAKCKADKQKGEKDLKIKKADFEKLLSRSDSATAKFAMLGEEIAELGVQLAELADSVKAATSFRTKDKKENEAVIADSASSIETLNGAISVLTEYYASSEAPAFVQLRQPKTDSANVIIEILQTAQEDFEKLKQETEAAESKAQDKHEKDMQAAEVAKAKKTAMKEGKQNEKSSVNVQLEQITEDLADATKALDAAAAFLKGVMEACANKAMSFEERQKRRGAEIDGLKEALEILSPDAEFIQTGKFLARK